MKKVFFLMLATGLIEASELELSPKLTGGLNASRSFILIGNDLTIHTWNSQSFEDAYLYLLKSVDELNEVRSLSTSNKSVPKALLEEEKLLRNGIVALSEYLTSFNYRKFKGEDAVNITTTTIPELAKHFTNVERASYLIPAKARHTFVIWGEQVFNGLYYELTNSLDFVDQLPNGTEIKNNMYAYHIALLNFCYNLVKKKTNHSYTRVIF